VLPIVVEISEAKEIPKSRAGKQSEVDVGTTTRNPFPSEHIGLCPHCHKAADVSSFSVDSENRIWCNQSGCKSMSVITHWVCVKCSRETNTQRKASKDAKVKFENCVCYAKLLARQGKIVLRCPQSNCRGWKDYDELPTSSDCRIICHVCSSRQPLGTWHCFGCNMSRTNCICTRPSIANTSFARKRPASVLKRPAQQSLPTSTSKRCRR